MGGCSDDHGRDRRCALPAGCSSGVNDDKCLGCGRARPGLFGLTALLRQHGLDDLFVPIVMWGCGAVYLASLAMDPSAIGGGGGLFSLLSPGIESLFVLGASGSVPVFRYGRWWTILSASWLHGGILHIVLNMMSVRNLGPAVSEFYGGARTVIIYFVAGAAGFLASSFAGAYLTFLPGAAARWLLHGRCVRRHLRPARRRPALRPAGRQRPHPGDRHPLDPHGPDRRFRPRPSSTTGPTSAGWPEAISRPSGSIRSSRSAEPTRWWRSSASS